MAIEKKVISSDGTTIAYKIERKKGPFVIFLGGISGIYDDWENISLQFQKAGYSTIAVDYRGCGLSSLPKTKKQFEMEYFEKDVLAIMKEEKIKKINIFGHCFGGMLALKLYEHHPNKVKSIITLNGTYTNPYSRPQYSNSSNSFFRSLFRIIFSTSLAILDNWPLNRIPYKKMDVEKVMKLPAWYVILSATLFHTHFRVMLASQITMIDLNAEKSLKNMKIPLMIIASKNDPLIPLGRAIQMKELNKKAELLIIENSHEPIMHFSKKVISKAIQFLKKQ